MARSSTEILSPARTEIARGRPRAALKELEAARAELLASGDAAGLTEMLELARGVPTLAPVDTKSRERLLSAIEHSIASLSPGAIRQPAARPAPATLTGGAATFYPYASVSTEQILAPARSVLERGATGRALRSLEKARRKLLDRSDVDGLGELLDIAQRIPTPKARHEKTRRQLIDATQQNVRYLSRRRALRAGEEWSDPFAAAGPKTTSKLPSLPPMTRREILIAAAIVVVIAGGVTAWALANRAPQRVAHAIKCPTGEEGGPTWSPDGKRIAFAKNGTCGTRITVVSVADRRMWTVTDSYGVLPDWSPHGDQILYRSRNGFSVVAAGGGEPLLLRGDDGDMGAAWSPDGQKIAFVHGLDADPELDESFRSTLYTMKPDGSGARRLIGHKCNPRTPAWSPSGKYLLFACDDGVYDLPVNGGSRNQLVECDFSIWPISVSMTPDAELLAFGWSGIETMRITGHNDPKTFVAVDDPKHATITVDWSPDGRKLAYSITGSGSDDGLYVIDRNGGHRRLLAEF